VTFLVIQMGAFLAITALVFFVLGYWYSYSTHSRKKGKLLAAKERNFHENSQEN
jgi:hypothetical protein